MAAPIDLSKLSRNNLKTLRESAYSVGKLDDISGIDYQKFFYDYLVPNKPCIFDPCFTDHWRSRKDWVTDDGSPNFDFLRKRFGKAVVPVADCKQEEFSSHPKQDLTLEEYLDYWENYRAKCYPADDPCLYLKDWHFTKAFPSYEAYKTPKYFQSDWLNEFWDTQASDDYRFVYMGPRGTWTPFHSDVYRSFSWSANICGKKKWIFYPPGCEVYMKDTFGNLVYDVTSPEFNDHHRYSLSDRVKGQQLEVIQGQGQIIFVPSGWHHQVYNLEDTISINHNWLNGCNIDICWHHIQDNLQNVKMEIDDLKDMDGWNEQCQLILNASAGINYETFIQMLKVIAINRLEVLGINRNNMNGKVRKNEPTSSRSIRHDSLKQKNIQCNYEHVLKSNSGDMSSRPEDAFECQVQLDNENDAQFDKHGEYSPEDVVDVSRDTKASIDINSEIKTPLDDHILTDCVDTLTLKTRDQYKGCDLDTHHPCDSKTTITDEVADGVKAGGCSETCIASDSDYLKHGTKQSHDGVRITSHCDTEDISYNALSEQVHCNNPIYDMERESRKAQGKSTYHIEDENMLSESSIHCLTQTDYVMYDLHRIKEIIADIMKDKDYTALNFDREKSAEYVYDLLVSRVVKSPLDGGSS